VGLKTAGLAAALALAHSNVLGDVVHAYDEDTVLLSEDLYDVSLLAAVSAAILLCARDDLYEVTFLDFCHD
jgi:hypothetical protein